MVRVSRIYPIILGALSCLLILFWFFALPKHLAFDEIEFAKIALSLDKASYIPYTTMANGHSTLYFYVILASFKLFGVNAFALRLPSMIFGITNVFVFYLLLKKLSKNDFIAFLTALLLLTQRWYYNFARFSFEATFLLFLELSSLYLLITYSNRHKTLTLLFSAFFAGLAFNSYYPGRIFFLIPLVFLYIYDKKAMLVFLVTFAITIFPLVFYLQFHPDTRVNQLLLFSDTRLTPGMKISQFGQNIISNVSQLYIKGDMNGRHNYPGKAALNPLIAILFTIGLIVGLHNIRSKSNLLFFVYFIVGFSPPLFVYARENPNMLRSFTLLPGIAFFANLAIQKFISSGFVSKKIALTCVFLIISLATIYDGRTYFIFQKKVSIFAFEVICRLDLVIDYHPKTLGDIPPYCRT